jgi:hypothetical protein
MAKWWLDNRGDIKPISYGGRNDYLLYSHHKTNGKYRATGNHYHIWNNPQGGYSGHDKGNVSFLFGK